MYITFEWIELFFFYEGFMTKNFSMFEKRAARKNNIILFYVVSNLSRHIRLRVTKIIYLRRWVTHAFSGAVSLRVDELSYCLRYNKCLTFLHFLIRERDVGLAVGIRVIQNSSYFLAGSHRKKIGCKACFIHKVIFNVHHIDVRT